MIYANFAAVYDRLMRDVPYDEWIKFLSRLFEKHGIKPVDILDIGCGTGNVTIPLAQMGYRLTGLDMSAEMLSVAEEKARARGLQVNWLQQDMREMVLGNLSFDMVISMTDSLNYLPRGEDLKQVCKQIRAQLRPGGWFIFDLNSAYKIKEVFGDNVYTMLDDDISYVWENDYNSDACTCNMELTFFVKEPDGRYVRFSEIHSETGFEIEEVSDILESAGLSLYAVYAENSFAEPVSDTERIYFVAKAE